MLAEDISIIPLFPSLPSTSHYLLFVPLLYIKNENIYGQLGRPSQVFLASWVGGFQEWKADRQGSHY